MVNSNKKKKFVELLNRITISRKEQKLTSLANHQFYIDRVKKESSLFDYLLFRALLEQAEGLSLTFTKPHSFTIENKETPRLSREIYEALDKAATLRPTRLGPLTLIG